MAYSMREVTKQGKRGALSLLGAMIATTALVSALPAVAAQTTEATCGATAKLPYYHNGRVYSQGVAWCNNSQPAIGVQVAIFRDGRQMDGGSDTCGNARTCHETISWPNSKGNQRWCTRATRIPGGDTAWACENRGF
jgi:hypothetical protein